MPLNHSENITLACLSICSSFLYTKHLIKWPSGSISCMHGSREGEGVGPTRPENHKNIGFLSNTGPDLLVNNYATKPEFNVGPPSAC